MVARPARPNPRTAGGKAAGRDRGTAHHQAGDRGDRARGGDRAAGRSTAGARGRSPGERRRGAVSTSDSADGGGGAGKEKTDGTGSWWATGLARGRVDRGLPGEPLRPRTWVWPGRGHRAGDCRRPPGRATSNCARVRRFRLAGGDNRGCLYLRRGVAPPGLPPAPRSPVTQIVAVSRA